MEKESLFDKTGPIVLNFVDYEGEILQQRRVEKDEQEITHCVCSIDPSILIEEVRKVQ